MGFPCRLGFNTLFLLVVFSSFCSADLAMLSEEELGEFVAEEGVCDIRLPDTCNTDPELMKTMTMGKQNVSQAIMEANSNADLTNAIRIGQINLSIMPTAVLGQVIGDVPLNQSCYSATNLPTATMAFPTNTSSNPSASIILPTYSTPPETMGQLYQSAPQSVPIYSTLIIYAH